MAGDTAIRSDDNLTRQVWAEQLFRQAAKLRFVDKFTGKNADSLIHVKEELTKEAGDKIMFGLRYNLDGAGRSGAEVLEGYEEEMVFRNFGVTTYTRRQAVSWNNQSQKRVSFGLRAEAKDALSTWLADLQDDDFVLAMSGLANPAVKDDDGSAVAAVAHSTNRKWYGGQTTAGVVTAVATDALITNGSSAHLFGSKVIEAVKRKAELATPKIRPIKVNGKNYYVMFIHPYQKKALMQDTGYTAALREAADRGKENPIFTGADSVWDGVVVHTWDRILTRLGAGGSTAPEYFESGDSCYNGITVARALFCGAQAAVQAWSKKPTWTEDTRDYEFLKGIGTELMYNCAKTRFATKTSSSTYEDFGVITVDTAVVPD